MNSGLAVAVGGLAAAVVGDLAAVVGGDHAADFVNLKADVADLQLWSLIPKLMLLIEILNLHSLDELRSCSCCR